MSTQPIGDVSLRVWVPSEQPEIQRACDDVVRLKPAQVTADAAEMFLNQVFRLGQWNCVPKAASGTGNTGLAMLFHLPDNYDELLAAFAAGHADTAIGV